MIITKRIRPGALFESWDEQDDRNRRYGLLKDPSNTAFLIEMFFNRREVNPSLSGVYYIGYDDRSNIINCATGLENADIFNNHGFTTLLNDKRTRHGLFKTHDKQKLRKNM